MTDQFILVLDAGTSSTRAILYRPDGTIIGQSSRELTQHYPGPGLVEHDAAEIWTSSLHCAREMVARAGGAAKIAAIGITNQRETVIAWDRDTGEPLAPAIVWQDRRGADHCQSLKNSGHEEVVQRKTGLRLDPYFSATKMAWLLGHVPAVGQAGERLALGTVESWLVYKLAGIHLTDVTNASRTLLLGLEGADWDAELLELFGIPRRALGTVVAAAGAIAATIPELFGQAIPITGLAGDQQAATIGQGCFRPGQTKLTLGTGAFVLTHRGSAPPTNPGKLLGTILSEADGERQYALEGAIFVAGSLIQWLRDGLGILQSASETEALARSVESNAGVTLLPALAGLGAPYWKPQATASIAGLSFATTRAHIARAALEAVSHQLVDLAAAFAQAGAPWEALRIDGGLSANDWLAQDIADMTGLVVTRPSDIETTARGAAILAAVGAGLYPSLEAAAVMIPPGQSFIPRDLGSEREKRLLAWHRLVEQA